MSDVKPHSLKCLYGLVYNDSGCTCGSGADRGDPRQEYLELQERVDSLIQLYERGGCTPIFVVHHLRRDMELGLGDVYDLVRWLRPHYPH